MNILVITPRFSLAGVPLAQFRFAESLAKLGHKVDFVIGFNEEKDEFLKSDLIKIFILNKKKVRNMFFSIFFYLIKNKPDIVFSAEDHLNIIVLISATLSNSKSKISCSSRVTPYDTFYKKNVYKTFILRLLNKLFARRADALTCVSEGMVTQFKNIFPNLDYRCVYNIVDIDFANLIKFKTSKISHNWLNSKIKIIAAGKLAEWKGFEYLINAMPKVIKLYPEVKLLILGDGPLKKKLQTLINNLNLGSFIELIGYVHDPINYFKQANIFVLSSLVEGMPNVLIEAMSSGCTVVSTDCETGPSEIIKNRINGFLVPVRDSAGLSLAIIDAIKNPTPKKILDKSVEPFKANNVIQRHFKLLGIK